MHLEMLKVMVLTYDCNVTSDTIEIKDEVKVIL